VKTEMTMKKLTLNDPETRSPDGVAENIQRLKALFPELLTEGPNGAAVNVDVLKALVGDATVTDADEKYGLNWHGKRRARQLALMPSTGTLRPCPEDSVDWDTTQNLMIEGDNLEVLKLLQKSYAGKVKLIYIDPPYNTGKDFVYPDDFQDSIKNYLELTGQVEGGRKISSNTEASGRFHTDWFNMIYARLKVARSVMRDDGILFISIDEREYAHLRVLCIEVFGEENIVGTIVWKNATDNNPTNIATEHEYILVIARSKTALEAEWKSETSDIKDKLVSVGRDLTSRLTGDNLVSAYQQWYREHKAELGPLDRYKYIDHHGVYTGSQSVHNPGREGYRYDVIHPVTGKPCKQPLMGYRFPKETMDALLAEGRILFGEDESKIIEIKVYASEFMDKLSSVLELDGRLGAYDLKDDFPEDGRVFSNPKPVRLLSTLFSFVLKDDGDMVLDFFAGSGATAKAVWALNRRDNIKRRFALVQLPEPLDAANKDQRIAAEFCDRIGKPRNIAEITKERLRRAAKKIKDENPMFAGDLGFRVFKLDSSNLRAWEPDGDNLHQTLLDSVEHIKADRTESDVLYELLLKLGLDLCVPIESRTFAGKEVHSVGGGVLMACLAPKIERTEVEALAQGIVDWRKALAPAGDTTCVFRDSAFADDVAKTNMAAILEQHGIANVRSL
jgi:adenine-specific DNA-methyltransferase